MTYLDIKDRTKQSVDDRIREGIKALLEQVMEEELTEQLQAGPRERTASRNGERNGHYERSLVTAVGKIEQLRIPRLREGQFLTEVFERYRRMTGNLEEAVLEMYLQGVSTRKIEQITGRLSGVKISKDSTSRIAQRLDEVLLEWRNRRLERAYPYVYLDATYLKVNWAGAVRDMALLTAIGVADDGIREVLAVESAVGERKELWRGLLKGLLDRGLKGVQLVISDDHESIKQAVKVELPAAAWQRCIVHFQRNILAHVPAREMESVAEDLKAIFQVSRKETALQLADSFRTRYQDKLSKAVSTLDRGLDDALTYMSMPSGHHKRIRTTNVLERLFAEVKRRTKVVGVFPTEASALNLSTVVMLRVSEDWALRRYLNMEPLESLNHKPTKFAT